MMVVLVVPITDDGVGCADAEAARADQVIIQTSSSPECSLKYVSADSSESAPILRHFQRVCSGWKTQTLVVSLLDPP